MKNLGYRLRKLRTERRLNVTDVARALGVSPSTYRDWEYGREIKGESPYVQLAKFYGVTLSYLITGEEERDLAMQLRELEKLLREGLDRINNTLSHL